MAVDFDKLGELIDGYWGVATADVAALPTSDARDEELKLLRDENVRLREALDEVELILTGLRGRVAA